MRENKKSAKPAIKLVNRSLKSVKELTAPGKKEPNRTAMALRRLGVSAEQLAAAPQITSILKRADGGMDQVLTAMRFAPDEIIAAFLKKFDSVPAGDRERVPVEAIALSAGVNVANLLGSIMVSLQAQSINLTKIIALTSHPAITQARVTYGLLPLGERDRTALDTALGFLPSPKAGTFINKAIFGSGSSVMDQQKRGDRDEDEVDDGMIDMDKLFPPANAMQQRLTAVRQRLPRETDDERKKPN